VPARTFPHKQTSRWTPSFQLCFDDFDVLCFSLFDALLVSVFFSAQATLILKFEPFFILAIKVQKVEDLCAIYANVWNLTAPSTTSLLCVTRSCC
jgi:hypothetical protein